MWLRLTWVLAAFAFFGFAALSLSYFRPQTAQLEELEQANAALTAKRDHLLAEKERRLADPAAAAADPEYIEVIARDRLNLQRPGETILRIDRGPR